MLAGAHRLVDAVTKDFERWSYDTAVADREVKRVSDRLPRLLDLVV
ncbi:hypothetical protein ABT168_31400 [Streptomyces sp. NPDC001793]